MTVKSLWLNYLLKVRNGSVLLTRPFRTWKIFPWKSITCFDWSVLWIGADWRFKPYLWELTSESFYENIDLECLIKNSTCFYYISPSFIDLILTNKKEFFKNAKTGISDHCSLTVTVLRSKLVKSNTKAKLYRAYNLFDVRLFFKEDLDKHLLMQLLSPIFKISLLQNSIKSLLSKKILRKFFHVQSLKSTVMKIKRHW